MSLRQRHDQFVTIYEEYKDRIYSYVLYRSGRDPAIAEDLTSQIFLKAYQAYDPRLSATARAWLFTIARNTLTDHYRSRRPTEELDLVEDTMALADETTPEVLFEERYEEARLTEALWQLPEVDRQYVEAHFFEHQTSQQIAEQHDTTAPAVRKRISRAVAKLRTVLTALLLLLFP